METKKKINYRKITFWIVVIVITIIMLTLPFIVRLINSLDFHILLLEHDYTQEDLLSYYSNVISSIITLGLGVLSVYQASTNNNLHKELESNNLKLINKFIDQQIKKEFNKKPEVDILKFDISLDLMHGYYANVFIKIQNTSKYIISDIKPMRLIMKVDDLVEIADLDKQTKKVLESKESLRLEYKNKGISKGENKNLVFEFRFSCKDEQNNQLYYEARRTIDLSQNIDKSSWDVEKIEL